VLGFSFGTLMHTPLKNEAMGMALAVGDCQTIKIPNNQRSVGNLSYTN
jgi:hypothetical protein